MSFNSTPVMVYPQCKDFAFDASPTGYSASVTFLETSETLAGETKVALPKLGDSFPTYISNLSNSDEFTQLTATRIYFKGWLGTQINCGKFWGVDYTSGSFLQNAENIAADDLPTSIEITGEMVAWEPTGETFNYKWSGGEAIKQPQFRPVITFKRSARRVIKDLPSYTNIIALNMNLTNNEELFGFPEGAVLFKGANATEFRYRGSKRWVVMLDFEVRKVNGKLEPAAVALGENADGWGWNWQINRNTGYWDIVVGPAGDNRYYAETSLDQLFDSDPLGPDEDLYEDLPVPTT